MKRSKWFSMLMLVILAALITPITVHADMAPPEGPPGINIFPGNETTQVRMVAETVTLTVRAKPSKQYYGQADTEAVFTMRNLGTETETMDARFPLTFYGFSSPGNDEINDLRVFIAGKPVQTKRIQSKGFPADTLGVPWASFPVSFPPGKDVIVTVKYTTNSGDTTYGFTADSTFSLNYILETGAGWKDTIGSADIIVKLPYEASSENVINGLDYKLTFAGKEVRLHLSDFEPSSETNFYLWLVRTEYWQKVLEYRQDVKEYPNNGEFWGQLGKAIKEVIRAPKGYLRSDPAGKQLYQEAFAAYQKAVQLLPKDALWHYGFADLIWSNHFFGDDWHTTSGELDMAQIVDELRQSLALDPYNEQAKELADRIAQFDAPYIRKKADGGYDFPVLTATLTAIPATARPTTTPTTIPATATRTREATFTPLRWPTQAAESVIATHTPVSPTKTPAASQPLCGGAGLVVLPALTVFWLAAKKKKRDTHLL